MGPRVTATLDGVGAAVDLADESGSGLVVEHTFDKLGVHSRAAVAAEVARHGAG